MLVAVNITNITRKKDDMITSTNMLLEKSILICVAVDVYVLCYIWYHNIKCQLSYNRPLDSL